jgi:vacuolar iron transporter family protein
MPATPHVEKHFTSSESVRDLVIGMSDGLTVPFALAAGLSGAVDSSHIIVTAGFAEIAAGAIAMGLGGFLAARSDEEHYASELRREHDEVKNKPEAETAEVVEILQTYGVPPAEAAVVVEAIKKDPKRWVDFMMRFELGLEEPDKKRALRSALTIAGAYIAGGMIPLTPYLLVHHPLSALQISVGVTLVALGVFGGIKGHFTGAPPLRAALQTMLIGGLAAGAAFLIARAVS